MGSDQPHGPWRRSPGQIPGRKRAGAAAADPLTPAWGGGEGAKVIPGAPSGLLRGPCFISEGTVVVALW